MKVRDLIRQLKRLESADDCEVFLVTRSGANLEPTIIGTEQGAAYVSCMNIVGRCVMIDTYFVKHEEDG